MNRARVLAGIVVGLMLIGGCKSAYYSTWEKLGWAKRDILVDRVKDARDDQDKAKEQFKTALQKFQELTGYQGGDLEAEYKKLNAQYESCVSRADTVRSRIKSVDSVAQDLFAEWQKEIGQYQSDELRRSSEQKLRDTQERYKQLYNAMKTAESKMDPVLRAMNDQVLFLKHNLNAAAIASLQTTVAGIQDDVARLVKDMEASIREADSFIQQMK